MPPRAKACLPRESLANQYGIICMTLRRVQSRARKRPSGEEDLGRASRVTLSAGASRHVDAASYALMVSVALLGRERQEHGVQIYETGQYEDPVGF